MSLPTVSAIEAMDRAALLAAWGKLIETPVPKGLSQAFLKRFLAYDVQARSQGGLPKNFLKQLEHCKKATASAAGTGPAPGGRLLREWNGITHVVDVGETGYRWNGATYRSLSAVARAITGARWSGPRFFGLTEESP